MMEVSLRDRAIDEAYREHAAELYRVAFGILRDPDEALDATQDAFARAWERWDRYDIRRPLRPWLHGIVVHLAIDRLRRRRVRDLAIPILGRTIFTDLANGPGFDPAGDVVRRQIVDEALASVGPRVRAALVLRYYYDYDYAQIGTLLGIKMGTVGSILSRGHAELRRRLSATSGPANRPTPRASTGAVARSRSTFRIQSPKSVQALP